MFEADRTADRCSLSAPGARWLSTCHRGGYRSAETAWNLTVPEGFDRTDLEGYVTDRLADAGLDNDGPVLLTGVDVAHARAARLGSVTVVATAGLSNPATLPLERADDRHRSADTLGGADPPFGTVNLLVGTGRALSHAGLATLLATAVEAKTATLQAATGFTGTTSDAVAVGADPGGEAASFAGSSTAVGRATRACVRDAVLASLDARYASASPPASVDAAEYGVVTDERATVYRPGPGDQPDEAQ